METSAGSNPVLSAKKSRKMARRAIFVDFFVRRRQGSSPRFASRAKARDIAVAKQRRHPSSILSPNVIINETRHSILRRWHMSRIIIPESNISKRVTKSKIKVGEKQYQEIVKEANERILKNRIKEQKAKNSAKGFIAL